MTTKTQIEIDFDVNNKIKSEIAKQRKLGKIEVTKERHLGIMIEERQQLEHHLKTKKLTFKNFLDSL